MNYKKIVSLVLTGVFYSTMLIAMDNHTVQAGHGGEDNENLLPQQEDRAREVRLADAVNRTGKAVSSAASDMQARTDERRRKLVKIISEGLVEDRSGNTHHATDFEIEQARIQFFEFECREKRYKARCNELVISVGNSLALAMGVVENDEDDDEL